MLTTTGNSDGARPFCSAYTSQGLVNPRRQVKPSQPNKEDSQKGKKRGRRTDYSRLAADADVLFRWSNMPELHLLRLIGQASTKPRCLDSSNTTYADIQQLFAISSFITETVNPVSYDCD